MTSSTSEANFIINIPKPSGWVCYMFGNRPDRHGLVYSPPSGSVPNWFVRWMMKVCFDCLWIYEGNKDDRTTTPS